MVRVAEPRPLVLISNERQRKRTTRCRVETMIRRVAALSRRCGVNVAFIVENPGEWRVGYESRAGLALDLANSTPGIGDTMHPMRVHYSRRRRRRTKSQMANDAVVAAAATDDAVDDDDTGGDTGGDTGEDTGGDTDGDDTTTLIPIGTDDNVAVDSTRKRKRVDTTDLETAATSDVAYVSPWFTGRNDEWLQDARWTTMTHAVTGETRANSNAEYTKKMAATMKTSRRDAAKSSSTLPRRKRPRKKKSVTVDNVATLQRAAFTTKVLAEYERCRGANDGVYVVMYTAIGTTAAAIETLGRKRFVQCVRERAPPNTKVTSRRNGVCIRTQASAVAEEVV